MSHTIKKYYTYYYLQASALPTKPHIKIYTENEMYFGHEMKFLRIRAGHKQRKANFYSNHMYD